MTKFRIAVVGAGFSGAVIADKLAKAGFDVDVFDIRGHVAGNCHTARDAETNVMVHVYGPHIFHTSNVKVWEFVNSIDEFVPFINRVRANADAKIYSMPINLMTINQVFNRTLSPHEARAFIASVSAPGVAEPQNFEEQALTFVGSEIYEKFFKGYTLKQWGRHPTELPASILKRIPVRFSYDDNYYTSRFQGMPRHGYTYIVEKLLDHKNITVNLNTAFDRKMASGYHHVFNSGAIDGWFSCSEGRLAYRTLDFEEIRTEGDFQGNAVINYCDQTCPWTRISEHKHFSPWESHEKTVVFREYSRACTENDIPYYPVRLVDEMSQLGRYVSMAKREQRVTFLGRLGTYRYLDMDITIAEAMEAADVFLSQYLKGDLMPAFVGDGC